MPHLPKTLLWVLDPAYFTDALVSFLPQCVTDICENTLPGNTFFALNQPCAKGSLKGRKRKALDASRGTKPQYIQHIVEIGRASCRKSVDLGGRSIIRKKKSNM